MVTEVPDTNHAYIPAGIIFVGYMSAEYGIISP